MLKISQRVRIATAYSILINKGKHEAPRSEYYNSSPSPNGWKRHLKQARGPTQWENVLVGSTVKHHGVNITTPTPPPHGWERYLKQARGPAQWEFILVRSTMKHHGVNITTPPLPPWMGEVLKTSERACTVRAYLGWKHHEAPWSEYYNSTPSPHGWERYLKEARRPAQWDLILVGSPMKHLGVNIATPPTTCPSLDGMLVHHSIAHQYVAI